MNNPMKRWKLSPMDIAALTKWDDYTEARDTMLRETHTEHAPWVVVRANDKKRAHLNLIRHLLLSADYDGKDEKAIGKIDDKILGFGHGFVMQRGDVGGGVLVGQCPPDADTFHRGEREVEPGDRLLDLVAFAVDPGNDVLAGGVFIAVLVAIERAGHALGKVVSLVGSGAAPLGSEERLFSGGNRRENGDISGVQGVGPAQLAGAQRFPFGHHLIGVRV